MLVTIGVVSKWYEATLNLVSAGILRKLNTEHFGIKENEGNVFGRVPFFACPGFCPGKNVVDGYVDGNLNYCLNLSCRSIDFISSLFCAS